MARTSTVARMKKPLKFATRFRNRCRNCGKGRSFYRDFGLCRMCFRSMAHKGFIPGVVKSSW